MAKYKVVNQAVEINGKTRQPDEVLDESEFRPVKENQTEGQEPELGELESLLKSGHVVAAE